MRRFQIGNNVVEEQSAGCQQSLVVAIGRSCAGLSLPDA
jgi:hypothetical protein